MTNTKEFKAIKKEMDKLTVERNNCSYGSTDYNLVAGKVNGLYRALCILDRLTGNDVCCSCGAEVPGANICTADGENILCDNCI